MLKALKDAGKLEHGGDRKSKSQSETLNLSDLNLTKSDSSRDQMLAGLGKMESGAVAERPGSFAEKTSSREPPFE